MFILASNIKINGVRPRAAGVLKTPASIHPPEPIGSFKTPVGLLEPAGVIKANSSDLIPVGSLKVK